MEFQSALDLFLILVAVGFCMAGINLRRYLGAHKRGRPIKEKMSQTFIKKLRSTKVRRLVAIEFQMSRDVRELLCKGKSGFFEAKALLPLITEARQHADFLLRVRGFHHAILFPIEEFRLVIIAFRLKTIEQLLRTLPTSTLSLEDVLAGRFDLVEHRGNSEFAPQAAS